MSHLASAASGMALSGASEVSFAAAVGRTRRQRSAPVRSVTVMRGNGKFVVGGNWKSNGTRESVLKLVADLNAHPPTADVDVICAPTFLHLDKVISNISGRYQVAAQNTWIEGPGAYTGEIAAEQILDMGAKWVILGHSERRALCGETSQIVGKKTKRALSKGLSVIVCVGETLAQRESNSTMSVIYEQLAAVSAEVTESDWSNIVIAYEPVWAIGTGKVATPAQAQEVHAGIRKWLSDNVSTLVSSATRIQYGGSVNAGNCAELAKQEDIDGFLVGGASLKADDFVTICNAATEHYVAVQAIVEQEEKARREAEEAAKPKGLFGWFANFGR